MTTVRLWLAGAGGNSRLFKDGAFSTVEGNARQPPRAALAKSSPDRRRAHMDCACASGLPLSPRATCTSTCGRPRARCRWRSSTRATAWPAARVGTGTAVPSWTISSRLWFVTSRGLSIVDPGAIGAPTPIDARVDGARRGRRRGHPLPEALPRGHAAASISSSALALTPPPTTRASATVSTASITNGWTPAPAPRALYQSRARPVHVPRDGDQHRRNLARTARRAGRSRPSRCSTRQCGSAQLCLMTVLGRWRWPPCGALHLRRSAPRCRFSSPSAPVWPARFTTRCCRACSASPSAATRSRRRSPPRPRRSATSSSTCGTGSSKAVREARQSILGLRSPALQNLGLPTALRTTGENLTAGSGSSASSSPRAVGRPPPADPGGATAPHRPGGHRQRRAARPCQCGPCRPPATMPTASCWS